MDQNDIEELLESTRYIYEMQDPDSDPGCSIGGALMLAATGNDFEDYELDEPRVVSTDPTDEGPDTREQYHNLSALYPETTRLAQVLTDLNEDLADNESMALHHADRILQSQPSLGDWALNQAMTYVKNALEYEEPEPDAAEAL